MTGREHPAPVSGQGRLFLVVDALLDDPDSEWWTNEELGVDGQDEMLEHAAERGVRPARRRCRATTRRGGTGARCTRCRSRATRSARRASPRSRCSSTADRIRSAAARRSSNATGWDDRRGLRDDHRAVDAHGGRPRRTSTRRAGTTSPARAATRSTRTTSTRPRRGSAHELTPWAFTEPRSMPRRPTR